MPLIDTALPGPGGDRGDTSHLSAGPSTFFPRKVTIKTMDGRELDFGAWRKKHAPASSVVESNTPLIHRTHQKRTTVVRMETAKAKEKRLAEEKEAEEKEKWLVEEKEKRLVEEKEKRPVEEERRLAEEERWLAEEKKWLAGEKEKEKSQVAKLEPVALLEVPVNRWASGSPTDEEQNVDRKVKALLNKLTMGNFDSISDQIIEWINRSEAEKDARTLARVTGLIFQHAAKSPWLEMYARLCRKAVDTISSIVWDDSIRDAYGWPICGGQLFKKHLVKLCQDHFERGWATVDATVAIGGLAKKSGEFDLYSDEYCVAQAAKRQGLCLIQFLGKLYKLQMLTERIMHECVRKLLANVDCPQEEEIESLCRLLVTVGKLLDNPKARAHVDIYFVRMRELGKSNNVAPRIQFILRVSSAVMFYHSPPHTPLPRT